MQRKVVKQDLVRVLHVFDVRPTSFVIHELNRPLSDGAGHDRHPHDSRRYPSERLGDTGGCSRPKPLGRCDLLSINNGMLTITDPSQASDTGYYEALSLRFS